MAHDDIKPNVIINNTNELQHDHNEICIDYNFAINYTNHAKYDLDINHNQLPPSIGYYHSSLELWPTTFRKSMDAYSTISPKSATLLQWCLNYGKSEKKREQSVYENGLCPSPLTIDHDILKLANNYPYLHDDQITKPFLEKSPSLQSQSLFLDEDYEGSVKEEESKKEVMKEHTTEEDTTQKVSFWGTLLHAMNVMVGIGLLTCPYALKEGGWMGLLALVIFATTCCYTGHLLRKCIESEPQDHVTSYPDIAQLAFGKLGRIFISVVLYAELYSYCVEFLILEGDHLSKFFPNFKISYSVIHMNSTTSFAIISTLIILPTMCIHNLKFLSILSLMGVITSSMVLLLIGWLGVVNKVGVERSSSSIINWKDLPIAIGVFGFCYSGHGVFPNIYHAMKDKTRYTTILVSSFLLCTLLFGGMAIVGYLMFQDQTLSEITLNVPKGYVASYIVLCLTIISPVTKFALIIAPIANGIEELVPTQKMALWKRRIVSVAIRVSILLSCLCVATLVPFFSYLMAFVGSAISMLVVAILPCTCFLKIYKENASKFEVVLSISIIGIGIISAIIGTYASLIKIYSSF